MSVVIGRSSNRNGKKKKKKTASSSSGGSIKIKPFQKPPTLPINFYTTCQDKLQTCMDSMLHGSTTTTTTSASREELYQMVIDLCNHNYGPTLYPFVMNVIDKAAFASLQRLTTTTTTNNSSITCHLDNESSISSTIFVTSLNGFDPTAMTNSSTSSNDKTTFLSLVWNMWTEYMDYINCIQSIFLHLDRLYVFIPENKRIVPRSQQQDLDHHNSIHWSLWEVGVSSLLSHLSSSSGDKKNNLVDRKTVLEAIQCMIVSHLLDELKSYHQVLLQESSNTIPTASNFHDPLIRNCISMLRNFGSIHLHNAVTDQFITLLTKSIMTFFQHECQDLIKHESYNARQVLRHMDARLKQVYAMTFYYLLSSSSTNYYNDNKKTDNKNQQNNNKILTSLVEQHLITPHYTTDYILHPTHLYPILDDGCTILPDVRRLYTMSKRVTTITNSTSSPNVMTVDLTKTCTTGTDMLRNAFGEYGKERGLSIVQMRNLSNKEKPNNKTHIVSSLLLLKKKLEMLHKKAFAADESFGRCIRMIVEDVVNAGGSTNNNDGDDGTNDARGTSRRRMKNNKSGLQGGDGGKLVAELVAKFVDLRLKSTKTCAATINNSSETNNSSPLWNHDHHGDMEGFQMEVLDLFRYVHSKDVFEAFYKQDLAKRLLSNKSASSDAEKSFISRLKAECGSVYTSKMEGMFKDMDLSGEVMSAYAAHLRKMKQEGKLNENTMDMDVQVLTTGYWPVYPIYPNLILPKSLVSGKGRFEEYYKSKYQGRRIVWQHSLGNCIVKAKFPKMSVQKELIINLLQATVLLCFNDDGVNGNGYTILDVMSKTGLDNRDEASRVLLSLSAGKDGTRVLNKIDLNGDDNNDDDGGGNSNDQNDDSGRKKSNRKRRLKKVHDNDLFLFNENFTSSAHRIRITNIQMKETPDDRQKTHEAVTRDRLYLIDAAIVRTMKARKTLDHNSLVGEVLNQVRFSATGTDIKKRIEQLIDREYMARSEDDRSKYNYVA